MGVGRSALGLEYEEGKLTCWLESNVVYGIQGVFNCKCHPDGVDFTLEDGIWIFQGTRLWAP